jgi:cytochrome c biogenesis protein CcdA/thiol-disulfide isomerase/thioredoxin
MQASLINIGLSFLEGLALIASPCILPILPIILAGSISGSKKRPFGIIIGFIIFFTLFTFFSRKLVQYSGVDLNLLRHISYIILLILGIIMLSSYLTEKFNQLTQRLLNTGSGLGFINNPQGGLFSGILFGGLVAIIWTPCAGPILAAVIVQTVIQETTTLSFLTLLAFVIGVAVPMSFIILFGRSLLAKFSFVKTHASLLRKAIGLIIILSISYIINLELGIVRINTNVTGITTSDHLINGVAASYPAPAIEGIEAWINSPPLQISELKGKVVLIDFWTYSCINCIRTLPYITDWYAKYHDKGLVIIGVHAPEFEFEKNLANVENAVKQMGILYPVALDNKFVTWRNYKNQYWPAHYLINKQGEVVYTHFGEGEYDVTENNIRFLLGLDAIAVTKKENTVELASSLTPETYFGYARGKNFASPETVSKDSTGIYTTPSALAKDVWALQGSWLVMPDKIISAANGASLTIHFYARHVYMVMGNKTPAAIPVQVMLDGKPSTGKDVVDGVVKVKGYGLYELVGNDEAKEGVLQVTAPIDGLELYTFTFGG